jgi:hypothetical protein
MTMSEKVWSDDAWADYLYWQTQDKKTLKRINLLIKDIERNGVPSGIGGSEALRGSLRGELGAASMKRTVSSITWRTVASTSFLAAATTTTSSFSTLSGKPLPTQALCRTRAFTE